MTTIQQCAKEIEAYTGHNVTKFLEAHFGEAVKDSARLDAFLTMDDGTLHFRNDDEKHGFTEMTLVRFISSNNSKVPDIRAAIDAASAGKGDR